MERVDLRLFARVEEKNIELFKEVDETRNFGLAVNAPRGIRFSLSGHEIRVGKLYRVAFFLDGRWFFTTVLTRLVIDEELGSQHVLASIVESQEQQIEICIECGWCGELPESKIRFGDNGLYCLHCGSIFQPTRQRESSGMYCSSTGG